MPVVELHEHSSQVSSPNGLKHMSGLPHLTLTKPQWDHTGSTLDCTTVLGEAGTREARNAGKACFSRTTGGKTWWLASTAGTGKRVDGAREATGLKRLFNVEPGRSSNERQTCSSCFYLTHMFYEHNLQFTFPPTIKLELTHYFQCMLFKTYCYCCLDTIQPSLFIFCSCRK